MAQESGIELAKIRYQHPDQPPIIWGDLTKSWEEVVQDGPVWMGVSLRTI